MYPPVKNAIVLMFDSLQYNYLGCNGNDWIKTPNFDRFSRESMVFDECYIEGLPTVPCRRAMHTGRYTLPYAGWVPLSMEDTTIADLCWGSNIDTAFIFDSPPNRLPKFGYSRGFDKVWFLHGHELDQMFYQKDDLIHYKPEDFVEDHIVRDAPKLVAHGIVESNNEELRNYLKNRQYWKSGEDQNVARVLKQSIKYLEERDPNKPFYLFIDSFDPHEPWDSPSVYDPERKCPYNPDYKGKDMFLPIMGDVNGLFTEEELHHVRMLYAENVTLCDTWLGYFMDNFKRLGLEKDTMIMLVSDHGEPMGNGEHGHGIMRKCRPWPYEELVHGVMMIKGPGIKPGRTNAFAQSCDVAPTVCDWLGLGVRDFHQGKSLLPICRREVEKVRDFAIAGYHSFSWSIITEEWSYVHWLRKLTLTQGLAELGKAVYEHGAHVGLTKSTISPTMSEEEKAMLKAASQDGEGQWTCTPGSIAKCPDRDELYSRKTDRFQLKNVLDKHPEIGQKLFDQLREFMGQLMTE